MLTPGARRERSVGSNRFPWAGGGITQTCNLRGELIGVGLNVKAAGLSPATGSRKSLKAAGINQGDECSPLLVMGSRRGCRTCLTLGDTGWARTLWILVSPALPDLPEHLCWLGPAPSLSPPHRAVGLTGGVLGENQTAGALETPNKPLGAGAWQLNLWQLFGLGSL